VIVRPWGQRRALMSNGPLVTLLLALSLGAGCASQEPQSMHFEMPSYDGGEIDTTLVWPPPPEVPRYLYIGDLIGEQNYVAPGDEVKSTMGKIWAVIAGLGFSRQRLEQLQRPQGIAVGPQGRIYVTDASRQAIFVFDEVDGEVEIWGNDGDGIALQSPVGIVALEDSVWVADSELGALLKFGLDGELEAVLADEVLERPTGLAADPDNGLLYVADTSRHDIKVLDRLGNLVGQVGGPGSGDAEFNAPTYLAFREGLLYVSDTLNARVQVIDPSSGHVRTVGKRGLYVGDMTRPKGVAVDSDDNLYVIESYYDHLLIYNSAGNLLLPIGGSGKRAGRFFQPAGIAIDRQNRVFIADMFNGRVAVYQYLESD